MKKTLSLLLTVAMLLAMIPAVVVSTSAATPTVDPIKITTHSATTNYANGDKTTDPVNWDGFWNITTDRYGYYFSETVELVGKFDKPTKVGHVDICAQYYYGRTRNLQVFLSVDGTTWVDLGYLYANEHDNDYSNSSNGKTRVVFSMYIPTEYANTEFQYVKILKDWSKFQDKDVNEDGVKDTYFDFNYAAVYPRTALDEPVSIKHYSNHANITSSAEDLNKAWNYETPSKSIVGGNPGSNVAMMVGQFESPTVIDAIHLTFAGDNADRMRSTVIEASVDGVNWNVIALTIPNTSLGNYKQSRIQLNSTDKTTAYNYIRIIKNSTWTFEYLNVGVFGTEQGADFIGTQVKKDTDSWALRLVSTVDLDTATAVGYEITAMAEGMTDKTWDKSTDIVYNSIKETTTEGENTLTALGLGGKYIFTATIHSISIADYDAIDFFVKPYVVDANGNKVYSVEQQFTFVDGVLQ